MKHRRLFQELETMEYKLGKIDAAVDQIDWAIRLLIDHQAYVPAITLAAAAEEITGAPLGENASFHLLKKNLSEKYKLSSSVVSQAHLNRARNWLKHWTDMKDNEYEDFDLEAEAVQNIVRAITNLSSHDQTLTSESPRFLEWLATHERFKEGF